MLYLPVAKLDIAADSDSEGRGFESLRADHICTYLLIQFKPQYYWGFLCFNMNFVFNFSAFSVRLKFKFEKMKLFCLRFHFPIIFSRGLHTFTRLNLCCFKKLFMFFTFTYKWDTDSVIITYLSTFSFVNKS